MGFGFAGLGALLTGGSVAGATSEASGGDAAVFGTKPRVADFTPTDLMAQQKLAIDSNLSNAGDLDKLLDSIMPGYSEMLKQGSANSLSLLRGEIPQDVQDQVKRSSAYQALIGGYAGSGMSKALTARDLGRTSLDMMGLGENSAQAWARSASAMASPWEITTPEQALMTQENNAGIQAQKQFQFNVDAAPDPAASGKFAIDSAIGMKLLGFGMSAAGSGAASDERLKRDVVTVGQSPSGHRIVEFNYIGNGAARYRGVIAQEAQRIAPEAVKADERGFLHVFYDLIDVPFEVVT